MFFQGTLTYPNFPANTFWVDDFPNFPRSWDMDEPFPPKKLDRKVIGSLAVGLERWIYFDEQIISSRKYAKKKQQMGVSKNRGTPK